MLADRRRKQRMGIFTRPVHMMRIALLEDNRAEADILRHHLQEAGHFVRRFDNGQSMTADLRHESYDLLLLDRQVPGMDGAAVLQWVRAQPHLDNVPVLFVTAEDNEAAIVGALQQGADDYLIKPVRPAELLARIEAIARRYGMAGKAANHPIAHGPWRLDPSTKQLYLHGRPVELTAKEFELAFFLFSNIGRLLSRGHLLQMVWGMASEVPTRTVDTHISKLRTRCQLFPENGMRLVAVYGYGYRLETIAAPSGEET